jgi:ABC-type multidrug transport system ATPase subunit
VMHQQEREALTDQMIASLGLAHCRDTEIGSASTKKISGGERKRVAIACELVTNPSLMFLDEPTSGLDSETALRLVANLHRVAHEEGRGVVMSIHQPSSAMLEFFDRVIVLR